MRAPVVRLQSECGIHQVNPLIRAKRGNVTSVSPPATAIESTSNFISFSAVNLAIHIGVQRVARAVQYKAQNVLMGVMKKVVRSKVQESFSDSAPYLLPSCTSSHICTIRCRPPDFHG